MSVQLVARRPVRLPHGSLIGVTGSAVVAWLSLPLVHTPPGVVLHTTGLLAAAALCAIFTLAAGVVCSIAGDRRMHLTWCLLGIALSLLPMFMITVGWDILAQKRGFVMSMWATQTQSTDPTE
jgi:hypothetical protein